MTCDSNDGATTNTPIGYEPLGGDDHEKGKKERLLWWRRFVYGITTQFLSIVAFGPKIVAFVHSSIIFQMKFEICFEKNRKYNESDLVLLLFAMNQLIHIDWNLGTTNGTFLNPLISSLVFSQTR